MARVLDTRRLLVSLQPELSRRLAEAHSSFQGMVRVVTEVGDAILHIDGGRVRIEDAGPSVGEAIVCRLPQTTLARLAMGTYPPDDLLARMEHPVDERLAELWGMMFPRRPAQIFLADRF
jgi:hypothetical protein